MKVNATKVGKELGISNSLISKVLEGKRQITTELREKVARHLGNAEVRKFVQKCPELKQEYTPFNQGVVGSNPSRPILLTNLIPSC